MHLQAFRIKNFRSIVDSGWVKLSPDGITAFVGQNECGKSSLLAGLTCALRYQEPTQDDLRIGADMPFIDLRFKLKYAEIEDFIALEATPMYEDAIRKFINDVNEVVEIRVQWVHSDSGQKKIERRFECLSPELEKRLSTLVEYEKAGKTILELAKSISSSTASDDVDLEEDEEHDEKKKKGITAADVAELIWQEAPLGVLFKEGDGDLPDSIDIDENGDPTGNGSDAAEHYLRIAGINLPELIKKDVRAREYILNKANEQLSQKFNSFWSQTIGKNRRLSLVCEINNYDNSNGKKSGQPHLSFWIRDGHTQLYPRQRSQGVRWFISFFLQLKASEIDGRDRVFLLDEPGANLHCKAQADVLKLINNLAKENSTVIYSTHSPQLVEHEKLYRVHALQRSSDLDDSPTIIIDAHRLGTAHSDTLSPLLLAMGSDLSNHQVIRKENNVLLEEMSGYYYLHSFWRMTKRTKLAHFIAATGVNKIEPLANMFRGWGLDFLIVVDDDKQAREAYKSLKRNLFGDEEELASKKLLRIRDCAGIEDVFSPLDFRKFILCNEELSFEYRNSEYVKEKGLSKPVLAFNFSLRCQRGEVSLTDFDEKSKAAIIELTDALEKRLS